MTKITLTDLVNLQNETTAVNAINTNNAVLKTASDNTLSRNGQSPNQMEASLDMNSNRILNLPEPISLLEPVRLTDLNDFSGGPIIIDPIPAGGLTGQVLAKNSNTSYDVSWTGGSKVSRGFTSVKDYGVKGDGISRSAVLTISSGSPLLTVAGASFTSSDVGKSILIQGAGPAGADLTTTILAFNSTANVTLATPASTTLSSTKVVTYGTDDTAALQAAQTAATTGKFSLFWPDGNYVTTSTLNFAFSNSRHVSLGNASIYFIGTGIAIEFDGVSSFLWSITFGTKELPFNIIGNSKATTLVYANLFEHSSLSIIGRECSATVVTMEASVLSKAYVECSVNNTGPLVTSPIIGLSLINSDYCDFEVIIEGIRGNGIEVRNSHDCTFTGTCEGNTGGGIYEGPGSYSNIFYNLDCEANTSIDWFLDGGTATTLYNCVGGSSASPNLLFNAANRTRIIQGGYHVISIDLATNYCYLEGIDYSTLTNLSSTTMYQRIYDGVTLSDHLKRPTVTTPILEGAWSNFGSSFRGAGYWQDPYGMVHLTGDVAGGVSGTNILSLPIGKRPAGSLAFNYTNAVDSSQGLISVSGAGLVTHGSGTTTFVSLDGISFLAEQ